MTGAMMLPMIASALAGLGGGGGGSGSGTGGSGEGGASGGLSPEAQKAIDVLKQLKDVYGNKDSDSDTETPATSGKLGSTTSSSGTGSGVTATKLRAHQLYQRNAATAFNNLDNELLNYMRSMAGNHKVDRKAVVALIRDVDVQLAEIGSAAYTKAGQEKVHQILTNALAKAAKIVSGGNATATGTAAEINRLTNQYIYNLAGREYTAASGGSGATTAAAQKAVSVAMAQQGDPYVWGAEGPGSFDCSGLMQYAARAAGANIPRVAADQYRQLPKVNPADIRPGDLIFPDSEFNNGNPGHVMMYIGNGQCVEAPRTGLNVRVTKLPSSYHASRWS